MRTNWFHILLSLADGEQHGYGIMNEVLDRTGGQVRLWPATLYGALRTLLDEGLILECEERPAVEANDARRRYYRISKCGHAALSAEIKRLEVLLEAARAKGRSLRTEGTL
jgi:DNA-binding PadR family transcriptional regulator